MSYMHIITNICKKKGLYKKVRTNVPKWVQILTSEIWQNEVNLKFYLCKHENQLQSNSVMTIIVITITVIT